MNKARHTPEEIKRYNKAFIKFMKPDEKPDGEESKEINADKLTQQHDRKTTMKAKDLKDLIPELQQWLKDTLSEDDLINDNEELITDMLEAYKDTLGNKAVDKKPVSQEEVNAELTAKITNIISES